MAPRNTDWITYDNQGATRDQPLSDELVRALQFLPELGVKVRVFSGGQAPKGSGGRRTGSTRHDHGNAADVFFEKDGRRLDWANPEDRPVFREIVRRGREYGLTGFGAGPNYMPQGSMHIGFGNPAVWGAGGSSANAPEWLRTAYAGAEPGDVPVHAVSMSAAPPQVPPSDPRLPMQRPAPPGNALAAAPSTPRTPRPDDPRPPVRRRARPANALAAKPPAPPQRPARSRYAGMSPADMGSAMFNFRQPGNALGAELV